MFVQGWASTISETRLLQSIKPLVLLVESGHGNVDDFEFADRSVAAAGTDVNRRHGPDRESLAVQFHLAVAFEDEINLGHLLVIMSLRVGFDIDHVHAGRVVRRIGKGPARKAAGTTCRRQFVELRDEVIGHADQDAACSAPIGGVTTAGAGRGAAAGVGSGRGAGAAGCQVFSK